MPISESLPGTFKPTNYVAKVWFRDLDQFLEEKCGRPYDSSEGLDFPSNGTMHEIGTSRTYLDEDEMRLGKEWLSGLDVEPPSLAVVFHLLADRGDLPEGTYLIDVWW